MRAPRANLIAVPVVAFVLAATIALPAAAGTGGDDGTAGRGLDGHTVVFSLRSSDSDTACVSYYETTGKDGPAKHFDRVMTELVELPWSTKIGTGSKLGHWRVTGWATDDCADVDQPDGNLRCAIKVDGKRKVRVTGTDHLIYCDV